MPHFVLQIVSTLYVVHLLVSSFPFRFFPLPFQMPRHTYTQASYRCSVMQQPRKPLICFPLISLLVDPFSNNETRTHPGKVQMLSNAVTSEAPYFFFFRFLFLFIPSQIPRHAHTQANCRCSVMQRPWKPTIYFPISLLSPPFSSTKTHTHTGKLQMLSNVATPEDLHSPLFLPCRNFFLFLPFQMPRHAHAHDTHTGKLQMLSNTAASKALEGVGLISFVGDRTAEKVFAVLSLFPDDNIMYSCISCIFLSLSRSGSCSRSRSFLSLSLSLSLFLTLSRSISLYFALSLFLSRSLYFFSCPVLFVNLFFSKWMFVPFLYLVKMAWCYFNS